MHWSIIVAYDLSGIIGSDNRLLWHLPADLRYFKQLTWGGTIVMGRRTHESIGRALPGRCNIVLSNQPGVCFPGCEVASSLQEAVALAQPASECFCIGGATLYAQVLPLAHRLFITRVHHRFCGDVYFPVWNKADWKQTRRQEHPADAKNPYAMTFLCLERTLKC